MSKSYMYKSNYEEGERECQKKKKKNCKNSVYTKRFQFVQENILNEITVRKCLTCCFMTTGIS